MALHPTVAFYAINLLTEKKISSTIKRINEASPFFLFSVAD
jgi:hypothetical protein